MLLITEQIDDTKVITEGKGSKKRTYIEQNFNMRSKIVMDVCIHWKL